MFFVVFNALNGSHHRTPSRRRLYLPAYVVGRNTTYVAA